MAPAYVKGTITDPVYVAAERARTLFCEIKRERAATTVKRPSNRNEYATGTHFQHLYKVAETCARHGWDIETYVRAAFDIVRRNHNYITPKDLTRDAVINAYAVLDVSGSSALDPRVNYGLQVKELVEFMKQPYGLCREDNILYSPLTPFEAWFRVLYPEQWSDKLFDLYGVEARNELSRDRKLRAFARHRFPRGMRELERRLGSFGDEGAT